MGRDDKEMTLEAIASRAVNMSPTWENVRTVMREVLRWHRGKCSEIPDDLDAEFIQYDDLKPQR